MKISHLATCIAALTLALLLSGIAIADNNSMACDSHSFETHAQLQPGDQATSDHLQLSRALPSQASIYLDVCSADLTVTGSQSGQLEIKLDVGRPATKNASDYLQALDISGNEARVQLHLPKSVRAKVTVGIPSSNHAVEVNLARGSLVLAADRVTGDRKFNVGYGHVEFDGDKDAYEEMQVNVGLGSLHDHRPGGDDHHFVVAHSFEGSGKGAIEINVGMGSVDLNPGPSQPI